jgi:hypothetical protein
MAQRFVGRSGWPLAKFAPRQSFRIAAGRRNDRKQRRSVGSQSELALDPGPQKIGYSLPRWLVLVSPASEHHKNPIGRRCVAANGSAVPSNWTRVGNEHPARPGARPNHNLSFAQLIGQSDGETLLIKKFSDPLLDVLFGWRAPIGTDNQF